MIPGAIGRGVVLFLCPFIHVRQGEEMYSGFLALPIEREVLGQQAGPH